MDAQIIAGNDLTSRCCSMSNSFNELLSNKTRFVMGVLPEHLQLVLVWTGVRMDGGWLHQSSLQSVDG